MDAEIQKMLAEKVIECVEKDSNQFYSPIFLRAKKNGEFRMILNLKKLNEYLPYEHFKMDHFENALNFVTPNMFFATVDIKKAYYSISLAADQRHFFCFQHRNKVYQYCVMPNGVGPGPRLFTKLMKPVYAKLRSDGHVSTGFIDDSLLYGNTLDRCKSNVAATVNLMSDLGFILNMDKSVLVPTQVITFLGQVIDSVNMVVYLPDEKKENIKIVCQQLLLKKMVTIRDLAKAIGLLISAFSAVEFGKLHYRSLEKGKIEALKSCHGNFEAKLELNASMKAELQWWIENLHSQKRKIRNTNPEVVVQTDSSLLGWGAVLNGQSIGGKWTEKERQLHINALEMLAILFAIKSFISVFRNKHVKVLTDSVTAVSYVNNFGGIKSTECDKISRDIWQYCISNQVWITCTHIPGVQNEADKPSRKFKDNTEWELDLQCFRQICCVFGNPEIDLFATRLNKKLEKFCSWHPDPEARFINAFSLNWRDFKSVYLFPPFSVIGRCIQKIQADGAEGILVVPLWPTQTYFPVLMRILVKAPLILPETRSILRLGQTNLEHPLARQLVLIACKVSGNLSETEAFLAQQPKSSCAHGGHPQSATTKHIYRDGFCSVIDRRSIVFQFLLMTS